MTRLFRASLALALLLGFASQGCGKKGKEGFAISPPPALDDTHRANLMSPQARFRKLSFHLRGITPSVDEYKALSQAITEGKAAEFFAKKTKEYLSSEQHLGKMLDRLDGLFKMKLTGQAPEDFLKSDPAKWNNASNDRILINAMDLLFAKMVTGNLSWDTLLKGKEYSFYDPIASLGRPSDLGFFNAVDLALPPSTDGVIRKIEDGSAVISPNPVSPTLYRSKFEDADPRIAGALTTSRFVGRYNTTALNKNRRRAAAIFRMFLCDDMKPVIPNSADDLGDLLDKVFPDGTPIPPGRPHATADDEKRHGSEPACMACHYKLDPMGKVFQTTGNVLSTEAAPGALVYKREDGSLVSVAVRGIGDLAEVLTEQPEYARCQVRNFWNWFVGKDVALSPARLSELTQEFDRVGRKVNDFIGVIVQQPEFLESRSSSFSRDVTFAQVKPMLQQCSTCHSGVVTMSIPDFGRVPIGGSQGSHQDWVAKIGHELDLAHNGAEPEMPPENSGWRLTRQELQDFREWIAQGAQDESSRRTIDEDWVKKILGKTTERKNP